MATVGAPARVKVKSSTDSPAGVFPKGLRSMRVAALAVMAAPRLKVTRRPSGRRRRGRVMCEHLQGRSLAEPRAPRRAVRCEDGHRERPPGVDVRGRGGWTPPRGPPPEPRRVLGGASRRGLHDAADLRPARGRAPRPAPRRLEESAALQGRPGAVDPAATRRAIGSALDDAGHPESRLRLTFAPPRLFVAIEPFAPLPTRSYEEGVACVTLERSAREPPRQGHEVHRHRAGRLRPAARECRGRADRE